MTKQRYDKHSTEFGLWLREQKEIDSKCGFVATNIDYLWRNYKTRKWMLLEEKRYLSNLSFSQRDSFKILHKACVGSPDYLGMHLLVFEKTDPEDGRIFWDRQEISKLQLLDKLQMKGEKHD